MEYLNNFCHFCVSTVYKVQSILQLPWYQVATRLNHNSHMQVRRKFDRVTWRPPKETKNQTQHRYKINSECE